MHKNQIHPAEIVLTFLNSAVYNMTSMWTYIRTLVKFNNLICFSTFWLWMIN